MRGLRPGARTLPAPRPILTMHGRGPEPEYDDPFADGLPTLDGARVRLRAARPGDVPDLLAVFGDARALRYWSHGPLPDLAAARTYYDGMVSGLAERRLFQWAVTLPADDRLVGTVTLVNWDRANRRAEIGFIVRPSHQGRGLAADAVRAVLAWAFGPMGLHRVEADVEPPNAASLALLERLGFRREGLFRERWWTRGRWTDSVMLGLLASDVAADPTGAG